MSPFNSSRSVSAFFDALPSSESLNSLMSASRSSVSRFESSGDNPSGKSIESLPCVGYCREDTDDPGLVAIVTCDCDYTFVFKIGNTTRTSRVKEDNGRVHFFGGGIQSL